MSDDVVAELDRWLADFDFPLGRLRAPDDCVPLMRRARDEIVALRERCALHDDLEFVSKNELTEALKGKG